MTAILIMLIVMLILLVLPALRIPGQETDKQRKTNEADRVFYDAEGNHIYYDRRSIRHQEERQSAEADSHLTSLHD